ncbi:MAG: DUF481 domain-containing protein [Cyclobacteriaceae bacterium]
MHHIVASALLVFIVSVHLSSAQILNVEKGRLKADSTKYILGVFGLSFNANNQSLTDDGTGKSFIGLTSNADVGYFSTQHSFLLIGELQYNATSEEDINSTGYGHFRVNWLRTKIVSYETFAQIQYDQGRGMSSRRLVGGGLRFRIYREEKSSLFAGIGAMYETEDWESPGENSQAVGIELWNSTTYVTSRFQLRENIAIGSIVYFQTAMTLMRSSFAIASA